MKRFSMVCALSLSTLAGCATPPSANSLAGIPVVEYPARPGAGEFIYKLPAGKSVDVNIRADGSLLVGEVSQILGAKLARDLYLYKRWASEDGVNWQDGRDLVGVNFTLTLPSHEFPGPGEMHLTVNRKAGQ